MNARNKSWLWPRVLTIALLSAPFTGLLPAGEPIQFSGPKMKIELPSGREISIPTSISIDVWLDHPGPGPHLPIISTPQLSLRDQMRLKEFIHEQQNWMFYDPHVLSGRTSLDPKPSLPLTGLERNQAPMNSTMQMLFGKPSDSLRPVIPLVRAADDSEFKSPRKNFSDPLAWPADHNPNSPRSGQSGFASGGTATRSMDRPEATFFEILNPGGRAGVSRDQMSRRASFNELLTPAPAPVPVMAGGLGPINLSGDTTRLPFHSGSGLSRELPTASRLGSILDPMQSFTAASRSLRSPGFDDPNARSISVTPAPAPATRQVEPLKMLKSPTVSEFPVRKF